MPRATTNTHHFKMVWESHTDSKEWEVIGTTDRMSCMVCGAPVRVLRNKTTGKQTLSAVCDKQACDNAMYVRVFGRSVN